MKKYFYLLLISFLIISFQNSLWAQEKDSLEVDEEIEELDYNNDSDFEMSIDLDIFEHPYIGLNYGMTRFNNNLSTQNFLDVGRASLKLGYFTQEHYKTDYLVRHKNKHIFINNFTKDLFKAKTVQPLELSAWQFGFGNEKGYGYKFGSSAIIPYVVSEYSWTQIDTDLKKSGADSSMLNLYYNYFRFGQTAGTGIQFQIIPLISLDANYSFGIVFPRHLFWKHLGSLIVEEIGNSSLDWFIKKIFKFTPEAGPIVNFVLKSGLSYAFFVLRKEKMNWPFNTTSPLTHESYNVGLKFNF
jgi:hypothetical protein